MKLSSGEGSLILVAREGSSKEVNSASAAAPMCLRVVGPAVHEAARVGLENLVGKEKF